MKIALKSMLEMLRGKRHEAAVIDTSSTEINLHALGKVSVYELLFYIPLTVWMATAILLTSAFECDKVFYRVSTIAFVVIVLNNLLFDRHTREDLLIFLILGGIAFNAHRVGDTSFGMNLLIIYSARNTSFRKVVAVSLATTALTVLFVVCGSEAGLVKDVLVPRGAEMRRSLGFSYTTFLSHYYLDMVLGYLFMRKNSFTYWELAVITGIDVLIYHATDSRNSFLLVLTTVVMLALFKVFRDAGVSLDTPKRLVAIGAPLSFTLCALLAFGALLWVPTDTTEGMRLNDMLSNRLELSQEAFETYPVGALGNEVKFSGWSDQGDGYMVSGHSDEDGNFVRTKYNYVDSSYLQTLIVHGWLPFAVLMTMLTVAAVWLIQQEEYMAAVFMCIFALHATIDPQLARLNYCCLLFAGCRHIDLAKSNSTAVRKRYAIAACGAAPVTALAIAGATFVINYGVPIAISESVFPDESLREYVAEKVDVNGDGKLSRAEAARLKSISVENVENISGLENFPNLSSLRAFGPSLMSADLTGAESLGTVDFSGAENLATVTLGGNGKLWNLNVSGTALEELDLSGAPGLGKLSCDYGVDVENAPKTAAYLVKEYAESDTDSSGGVSDLQIYVDYDENGRLSHREISGERNIDIDYDYDDEGALSQVTLSGDAELSGIWSIRHDGDGNMHAVGPDGMHVDRSFDAGGRVESLDIKSQGLDGQLEATLEFRYDEQDLLSSVRVFSNNVRRTYRVGYYANGTLRSIISGANAEYFDEEGTASEVEADVESLDYAKGSSLATERIDSSGTSGYEWQSSGKNATLTKSSLAGNSDDSRTVGTYRYEGNFPYPIWGSVTDYEDGSTKSFDVKYEKVSFSRFEDADVGSALDFTDLTDPEVATDYWLPKADLWWIIEREVKDIVSKQDASLTSSGAATYYDEKVYAESNKVYATCLDDVLVEVQKQYGGTPSYAYYDIDGNEDSELLIADGDGNLVRVYGQLQGVPYLSRVAVDGETLQLSSQGFLVSVRNGAATLERYNGLTFDAIESVADNVNLTEAYPKLASIEWVKADDVQR